jgi:hypothetical protein
VFPLLTDYLLLYRKVVIPAIGRFEIVQEPARLEFSEKLVQPPVYKIQFSPSGEVDAGLIDYLSQRQHLDRRTAEEKLVELGKKLKDFIGKKPVVWAGVGELSGRGEVSFRPALTYPLPSPVHAEKVFRENVAHTVLIGDREFQKTTEVVEDIRRRRYPEFMIAAFVLLILGLLFISWQLYMNNWHLNTASQWNGFGDQ